MVAIRGNVETRLAKLDAGQCDALVLAEAGLTRLGLAERITERLAPPRFFPAVGQGALAVEAREGSPAAAIASQLENSASRAAVLAERALLNSLQGGCLAPVAAFCQPLSPDQLELTAIVLSPEGRTRLFESARGRWSEARQLGEALAAELLKQGAGALIRSARQE
jgi:hydroxymethylbilane synthase